MARAPSLPEPFDQPYLPFQIEDRGWWLNLSDPHFPYHDKTTIELAVTTARRQKAVGVLLNGDVMDSHEISSFSKDPSKPRYREEVRITKEFFAYLRHRLPKARIVFKAGNHEERLDRYLMERAPALFGLDNVSLPAIVGTADYGIEFVGDKRVVRLGRLNVLHGHEYKPNVQTPVNPARGIFLRAKSVVMCGHWHQTSEHHEPTVAGKSQGAWSTGCACHLAPAYSPLNRWNHGFAMIHLNDGGEFSVRNLRVYDGRVV
jgi:predicted phosphodiesterase